MDVQRSENQLGYLVTAAPGETLSDVDSALLRDRFEDGGALLLRGFSPDAQQFEYFTERFGSGFVVHQNLAREIRNADGTTQTVTGGHEFIPLHRERAYVPRPPELLFFYCVKPPRAGGQTTLCDGVALAAALDPATRAFCASRRLLFVTPAPPRAWERTFGTTDKEEALARCQMIASMLPDGETCEYRFEGDILHIRYSCPLIHKTKYRGLDAFANFLIHVFWYAPDEMRRDYFAGPSAPGHAKAVEGIAQGGLFAGLDDGSLFPKAPFDAIQATAERLTTPVEWAPGDVLMIDNSRMMHGRMGFEKNDPREILVRMGYADF